ncbi:MAG TPA: 2'-5' RNA ligase family protein [Candidatus Saccharimonadales bacterium]
MKYSIVSYLDEVTTSSVRELQQTIADLTGSKASLLAWEPHVSVGDGISIADHTELEQFAYLLNNLASTTEQFKVKVTGFGGRKDRTIGDGEYSTPYVLWVNVEANEEVVYLVAKVAKITASYQKWYHMPAPYIPHVTIAFRDLDEKGYEKGLAYLKNKVFDGISTINHIALVRMLANKDKEYKRFTFTG